MNKITTWIGITLVAMGMIGGHMIFVADARYFSSKKAVDLIKEFVVFAERQKTAGEIQKENLKAIKRLNTKQIDMEKQWLRKEIQNLKKEKHQLQLRRRGQ